jgi:hypothetical protein
MMMPLPYLKIKILYLVFQDLKNINIRTPITIQDALRHVNAKEWQTTKNDELKCLKKNKTWKLITLPPNRTSRSSK